MADKIKRRRCAPPFFAILEKPQVGVQTPQQGAGLTLIDAELVLAYYCFIPSENQEKMEGGGIKTVSNVTPTRIPTN